MSCELVKKRTGREHTGLNFDDWQYKGDDYCLVEDVSLREVDEERFIIENITIGISKNGPHSRIEISGEYIDGFCDDPTITDFHYYKAFENHSTEQAQKAVAEHFKNFSSVLFDDWRDCLN